jgi:hypothetical protein
MSWNYRFVRFHPEDDDAPFIELREVFYDDQRRPTGHTTAIIMGLDEESIAWAIERINEARERPILDNDYDFITEEPPLC